MPLSKIYCAGNAKIIFKNEIRKLFFIAVVEKVNAS